jgi:hypothetical protein
LWHWPLQGLGRRNALLNLGLLQCVAPTRVNQYLTNVLLKIIAKVYFSLPWDLRALHLYMTTICFFYIFSLFKQ